MLTAMPPAAPPEEYKALHPRILAAHTVAPYTNLDRLEPPRWNKLPIDIHPVRTSGVWAYHNSNGDTMATCYVWKWQMCAATPYWKRYWGRLKLVPVWTPIPSTVRAGHPTWAKKVRRELEIILFWDDEPYNANLPEPLHTLCNVDQPFWEPEAQPAATEPAEADGALTLALGHSRARSPPADPRQGGRQ